MKTSREVFKETLDKLGFSGYKPSEMTNSDYWLCTTTAMEEYRQQQPDPQPIERLMDFDEDIHLWVKHKIGVIKLYRLNVYSNSRHLLSHDGHYDIKEEMFTELESFIIANVPRF